jgi:hypothetical protein
MQFLFILIISIIFFACQRPSTIQNTNNDTEEALKIEPSKDTSFTFCTMRAKINLQTPKESQDFKVLFRIQKDKKIWASARGALGIEGLRSVIREDSLFIINYLDKKFTEAGWDTLNKMLNFETDFQMLQGILLADMPLKNFDTINKKITDHQIIIKQKIKYIEIENYLNKTHQKLEKLFLLDTRNGHRLTIEYLNFKPYNLIVFPQSVSIIAHYIDKNTRKPAKTQINIEYNKLVFTHDKIAFPFRVPDSYREKKN